MKSIFILLVFASLVYGQENLSLDVDNCTYYYSIPVKQNNNPFDSLKISFKYGNYDNITEFKFHKNDSLFLKDRFDNLYSTDLKNATGVKMRTGSYFLEGSLIGVVSGTLVGILAGEIANNNVSGFDIMKGVRIEAGAIFGAFIGFCCGSVTGALIEKSDYINLNKIKETQRKNELIEFIKSRK